MKTNRTVTKRVTTSHRVELNREDIIKAVGVEVPDYAEIYVSVPGGGNWSNTSLEIDDKTPVVVSWDENVTEIDE